MNTSQTLLIELLTEELPPKSLKMLSEVLAETIFKNLQEQSFLSNESQFVAYASPRRLAVTISHVLKIQPEKNLERKGPSVAIAFDAQGKPTPALLGFAKSCQTSIEKLEKQKDVKGEVFVFRSIKKGEALSQHLSAMVETALKKLPIPKVMRWGNSDAQFVRPVHSLIMLHGKQVVKGKVLDLSSGNTTLGHRFLSKGKIKVSSADQYEKILETKGKVIASFDKRKNKIVSLIKTEEEKKRIKVSVPEDLLEEVCALVEYPKVYLGDFSPSFLSVPTECLSVSMQRHQKYFPVFDKAGKMLPQFLVVSNNQPKVAKNIIEGNERVLRARLSDAQFFFEQDKKKRLEERVPLLANVVYHNKLGSQLERVERLQLLAGSIARQIDANIEHSQRAAWLCKADLLTDMVGEFPELQGLMGYYYALHDKEHPDVAEAIKNHYHPRFAGDNIPSGKTSICVALADKLYTLVGMFGIGQQPTGDKDPFALRRHALGIARILIESRIAMSLFDLVNAGFNVFPKGMLNDSHTDLEIFIRERLRTYLRDEGYTSKEIESVLCMSPTRLDQIPRQLAAVRAFINLPEAESLVSANKRVANILKQAEAKGESFANAKADSLKEPAERALFDALKTTSHQASSLFKQGDFTGYLKTFAVLKSPVDAFFDSVMVMVDVPELRQNRLALLTDLRNAMNRVADISKLAM